MLTKHTMQKKTSLHIIELSCLIVAVFVVCYFLRQDDILPISINSVWLSISHCTRHFHLLAVALLPVYVSLMIFGTAVFAMYFGSILKRLYAQLRRSKQGKF